MATKQSSDLMKLLHLCEPSIDPLAKACYLEEIEVMDSYNELAHYKTFSQVFEQYYSADKLVNLNTARLKQVAQLMPTLPASLQDIVFSLRNGNAPRLTPDDYPDFYDADSIFRLHDKLAAGGAVNYTNIAPENFMDIFNPDTVKSGRDVFYQLPSDTTDFDRALSQYMDGKQYCISQQEIQELEEDYKNRTAVVSIDTKRRIVHGIKWFFIKLAIAFIAATVLSALVSALKINEIMENLIYAVWLLTSLVFIIGG